MCGKTEPKVAKKQPRPHRRPKCPPKRRYEEKSPVDVTESSSPDDVTESPQPAENPPDDVITTGDNKESEDVAVTAGGAVTEMSDAELACYYNYINKKLDEYEPVWVSQPYHISRVIVIVLRAI